MIKILICDDDIGFIDLLKEKVRKCLVYGRFSDIEYEIVATSNTDEVLSLCLKSGCHIAFLDIDMPVINGFDVASLLHEKMPETKIIFVSNLENMVYTSLKFNPFRFIRKNYLDKELKEAIDSAINELVLKNKYIVLGNTYSEEKVFIKDIAFLESRKNYVYVHLSDGREIAHRSTINNMQIVLRDCEFVRVHTAFLVNLQKIKYIHKDEFELDNGIKIKASRSYFKDARKQYFEYLRS